MIKLQIKPPRFMPCLASVLIVYGCNSKAPTRSLLKATQAPFADLQVGQQWKYVGREKAYDQNRVLTGDTVTITVIAKENGLVTFKERFIHGAPNQPEDTLTFRLQLEDSRLRQVGDNSSSVFRFLSSHDGVLWLTPIDSNRVAINLETSLFTLREQTGKNHFIGYAESVQLFLNNYDDLTVYYDERLTYVDGPGHVALFSAKEGMVGTIYFGGFSLFEQHGYELIKQ